MSSRITTAKHWKTCNHCQTLELKHVTSPKHGKACNQRQVQESACRPSEGEHGIRPQLTLDVMSNSPFVSQANTRQFGERI